MVSSLPVDSPWRTDFPIFSIEEKNIKLAYLDSASTAQTPQCVIDRMTHFYQHEYANVHRGVYSLSASATVNMELVRDKVANFMGAATRDCIVFTKGTTEAINLVANSYLKPKLKPGDVIVVTEMEHHANLVPWQLLAQSLAIEIRVWKINDTGELDINALDSLICANTKFLALTHISNLLGTVNQVNKITEFAHQSNIAVLIDGAQAVMHQPVNVSQINCDFYVFSAHKLYGPTGVGVLYAKPEHLLDMIPWEGGGAMIDKVKLPVGTTFNDGPWRFEAGTPNIAGIIGLGEAVDYIQRCDVKAVYQYEQKLMNYALASLTDIPELKLFGNPKIRVGVIAFNLGKHHAYDVGAFLDRYGVAVRTGHHCAIPLLDRLGQSSVCRASIGMYTSVSDIDALVGGLKRIRRLLGTENDTRENSQKFQSMQ